MTTLIGGWQARPPSRLACPADRLAFRPAAPSHCAEYAGARPSQCLTVPARDVARPMVSARLRVPYSSLHPNLSHHPNQPPPYLARTNVLSLPPCTNRHIPICAATPPPEAAENPATFPSNSAPYRSRMSHASHTKRGIRERFETLFWAKAPPASPKQRPRAPSPVAGKAARGPKLSPGLHRQLQHGVPGRPNFLSPPYFENRNSTNLDRPPSESYTPRRCRLW